MSSSGRRILTALEKINDIIPEGQQFEFYMHARRLCEGLTHGLTHQVVLEKWQLASQIFERLGSLFNAPACKKVVDEEILRVERELKENQKTLQAKEEKANALREAKEREEKFKSCIKEIETEHGLSGIQPQPVFDSIRALAEAELTLEALNKKLDKKIAILTKTYKPPFPVWKRELPQKLKESLPAKVEALKQLEKNRMEMSALKAKEKRGSKCKQFLIKEMGFQQIGMTEIFEEIQRDQKAIAEVSQQTIEADRQADLEAKAKVAENLPYFAADLLNQQTEAERVLAARAEALENLLDAERKSEAAVASPAPSNTEKQDQLSPEAKELVPNSIFSERSRSRRCSEEVKAPSENIVLGITIYNA